MPVIVEESWDIRIDSSDCMHEQNGLCYYNYTNLEKRNGFDPKLCEEKNCKLKIKR